jgi:hypothetical protein
MGGQVTRPHPRSSHADRTQVVDRDPRMVEISYDSAGLPSCRAHQLLERMAREIEGDEAESPLGRLLALSSAAGDCAEADAIKAAMHWAPAIVAGNLTQRELVRRLGWIVWPELMTAAVANYREILGNVAPRWASAIVNGCATQRTVIEELGMPPELVSSTVTAYERAYGIARKARPTINSSHGWFPSKANRGRAVAGSAWGNMSALGKAAFNPDNTVASRPRLPREVKPAWCCELRWCSSGRGPYYSRRAVA